MFLLSKDQRCLPRRVRVRGKWRREARHRKRSGEERRGGERRDNSNDTAWWWWWWWVVVVLGGVAIGVVDHRTTWPS